MSLQIHEIVENFPDLLRQVRGSKDFAIHDLQAAQTAKADSMIFVSSAALFQEALLSAAKTWVVSPSLEALVPAQVTNLIVTPNVQLAMALVAKRFFPQTRGKILIRGEAIHPRAVISPSARLGAGCSVGPGAAIGDDCVIGEDCVIGANTILEPGVKVGARTHIHPLVFIGHSCEIGADCEIHPHTTIGTEGYGYAQDKEFNHYRITHYGRVVVEDRVHIGAGVQIDRGTFLDSRIGAGTKIDNHCHFGHNILVGKNTLITGGMITAGSVTIGSYCVFGGRTTIQGHITIADKVHAGGLSAISKSVTKPGQYGGFPLQDIKSDLKTRASLKNVPSLIKQVRRILKHLGLESEIQSE